MVEYNEEEADIAAELHINELMRQGKAQAILATYYFCNQSCDYVYGIVRRVAFEETDGISEDVKSFARNLLDDWTK